MVDAVQRTQGTKDWPVPETPPVKTPPPAWEPGITPNLGLLDIAAFRAAGVPTTERAALVKELKLHGVTAKGSSSLDELHAIYDETLRREERRRPAIGLDGRVGATEDVERYERLEAVKAMNPGTTTGSLAATASVLASGEIDVGQMRRNGQIGNAVEGIGGGAGAHLQRVSLAREPLGTVRPDIDNFNRTGLPPRFQVKAMNPHYRHEDEPGNAVWNHDPFTNPTNAYAVTYATRPTDRAPFRLEAQPFQVGKGPNDEPIFETRLFDANGQLFDTREATNCQGSAKAIYVMNAQGELFASNFQEARTFHHSSLTGGEPVAAAGELVVEEGRVLQITNNSGHYRPDGAMTDQLIRSLREKGVPLTGTKVTIVGANADPFRVDERVLR